MVKLRRDAAETPADADVTVLGSRVKWGSPPREAMDRAQRYSRFVRIMKRALPIAAAVITAIVLAYALQPRDPRHLAMTFERLGLIENDLTMIHPRLTGTDDEGQPYVVTADTAVQDGLAGHRARLKKVQADVTLKDGAWINVVADTGRVDSEKRTLDLAGKISIYSDNGYEAHTSAASVDLNTGLIQGSEHIDAQGPLGTLSADRFVINRNTKQMHFTGNVHTVLYHAAETHAPAAHPAGTHAAETH